MNIVEDQNKTLAPVLHYKRMLEEIFRNNSHDQKYKRQIPLSFSATGDNQTIHGGVSGWISFDYSVLEVLWVDPASRRNGLGRNLLQKFEEESRKYNCSHLLTSTNSLSHSLEFWIKNGFKLLYTVEGDIPLYYLEKKLNS